MFRKLIILSVLFVIIGGYLIADGGGGMTLGYQTSQYPFFTDNYIVNNNMGLIYYGGFGYGVSRSGIITGGFGYAVMDSENDSGIAGGFGGVINGYRFIDAPITIAITSWTGFGGVFTGNHDSLPGSGYFCISEDINLEIGVPLLRWFMPVFFVGYQASANLLPGKFASDFLSYTPVIGFRISWGDFY